MRFLATHEVVASSRPRDRRRGRSRRGFPLVQAREHCRHGMVRYEALFDEEVLVKLHRAWGFRVWRFRVWRPQPEKQHDPIRERGKRKRPNLDTQKRDVLPRPSFEALELQRPR
jgi:hypothetical protein